MEQALLSTCGAEGRTSYFTGYKAARSLDEFIGENPDLSPENLWAYDSYPQPQYSCTYPAGPDFRPAAQSPRLPTPPQPFPHHGQLPGELPGLPRPLPGCAPGSSATLGSGPGVVPGVKGSWQKLGLMS